MLCTILILFAVVGCSLEKARRHNSDHDNTLFLVHVLFRHGQRTPQRTYPKDIHNSEAYYPYGYGELTNSGKLLMYNNGLNLRKRYGSFVGVEYNQTKVSAMSSSYSRTRMSCELVMAALFQPSPPERWHPNLNWQPTICDYVPEEEDYMFLPQDTCQKGIVLQEAEVQWDNANNKYEKYRSLFNNLSGYSGMIVEEPRDVAKLFDILRCQNEMGLKLPPWSDRIFPDPMGNISTIDWDYIARTDDLKKFNGGVLFKKILDDTKKTINGCKVGKKLFIYSGHDSNVVPLLRILNIYNGQIIAYGTMIMIEIHRVNNQFMVKVFVQDTPKWKPQLKNLPECGNNCTFEQFTKSYEKYSCTKDMCNNIN